MQQRTLLEPAQTLLTLPSAMLQDVHAVQSILQAYGATRIILYGSLARGDYRADSDIDICVEGIPNQWYFRALAECMLKIERPVTVLDFQNVTGYLRERILSEGPGYYNAIEHLIIRILTYVKITIPSGSSSHKDTLKVFESFIKTNTVHTGKETVKIIENLMAFRHVATKIYGFLIDQGKLQVVIDDIQRNHSHTKQLILNTIQIVHSEKP